MSNCERHRRGGGHRLYFSGIVCCATAVACFGQSAAAQTPAHWAPQNGTPNYNWGNPANWNERVVPNGSTFDVTIIAGAQGPTIDGSYTVNSLTFNSPNEQITQSLQSSVLNIKNSEADSSGTIEQTAGGHFVGVSLDLGFLANTVTSYGLFDLANLTVGADEVVGLQGGGVFVQQGSSTENSAYTLVLGKLANSTGAYHLLSGTLQVQTNFYVGQQGSGNFKQQAGSVSCGSLIVSSSVAAPLNLYDLEDGNLSAISETIGTQLQGGIGRGTFAQFGGTNSTGSIDVSNGV